MWINQYRWEDRERPQGFDFRADLRHQGLKEAAIKNLSANQSRVDRETQSLSRFMSSWEDAPIA